MNRRSIPDGDYTGDSCPRCGRTRVMRDGRKLECEKCDWRRSISGFEHHVLPKVSLCKSCPRHNVLDEQGNCPLCAKTRCKACGRDASTTLVDSECVNCRH